MNKKGTVIPQKTFHYLIFVLLFIFLMTFSMVFVNKAIRSSGKDRLAVDSVLVREAVIVHKLINDCFVYESDGLRELGVVDVNKLSNDILKTCIGTYYNVTINIDGYTVWNGYATSYHYYRPIVILDSQGERKDVIMEIGVAK